MRFSVVIATRGRPELLRATIRSLRRCDPGPDEVVVVDGDSDGSAETVVAELVAEEGIPTVRYMASRPGASVQRNRGIALASGNVVVFIDDDVLVDPKAFAVFANAYRDPSVVGATGRVIERGRYRRFGNKRSWVRRLLAAGGAEGSMTRFGYPRHIQNVHVERDVEFMPGCLMSARRELAARTGFDEKLEHPGGYALFEDEDFSYRLSRLGRVRYLPEAVVHHKIAGFRSLSADTRQFDRMVVMNRAYLFRKNFRQTALTRVQFGGLVLLLVVHRIINFQWAGILGLAAGALHAWRDFDHTVSRRTAI